MEKKEMKNVPDFQDIHIQNVVCRGCKTAIKAGGIPGQQTVHNIDIKDCTFVYNKTGQDIDAQTAQLNCVNVKLVENKKQN